MKSRLTDLRISIVSGTLVSATAGIIWMALYWHDDTKFNLSVLLHHILIGFTIGACFYYIASMLRLNVQSLPVIFSFIGFF